MAASCTAARRGPSCSASVGRSLRARSRAPVAHRGARGIPGTLVLVLLLTCVLPYPAFPQTVDDSTAQSEAADHGPFFYFDRPYGSDAYSGPLDPLLNDGYALSVNENRDRRVFQYDYGFASVWDAVTHPGAAIERGGGLSLWLRREIFPLTFTPGKAKWYTNYTGHLIEGGIMARRSMEWFRARGVPWPALWGGLVRVATSLLNEFYEMGGQTVGSAATVADLFVFDLGGILLFANDGVSRFFARTFNANIWPGQASITVPEGEIHNNASRLIVKIPWGVIPNTSLFYWTGIGAQGGLTFHRRDGLNVTVAMGADAKRMNIDPVTGEETVGLVYSAGVFVDRDNSLLASLNISAVEDRMITVNVFPGVIPLAGGSFGAWAEMTRAGKVRFGISSRYWLGAAIGFGGF